jgi:putative aldouronate transport system permease protein
MNKGSEVAVRRHSRIGKKLKSVLPSRSEWKTQRAFYTMMIPGILLLFVFNYIPMFGVILAFKDFNLSKGILGSDWAGFKNFEFFFSSQDAARITFNTIYYNGIFIVSGLLFALIFSLLLNDIKNSHLSGFYKSAMFLPFLMSWVVAGYISYAMFNVDLGIVNQFLNALGFDSVNWYSDAEKWRYILPIANLWKTVGYLSVIFIAGLAGIDNSYYEAAEMEGAGKIRQALSISLPMLMPIIVTLFLLQLGKIFYADFGLFYNLPRESGLLFSTTDVIDTYVFRALRTMGDIGMSSAIGLYQSVVGFTLVVLSNWIVRKFNSENALF